MPAFDIAVSLVALGLLVRIAVIDFRTLRIPNREVLWLCLPAIALAVPGVTGAGLANLVPAALLFVLGVVFWLLRMMGAGDAKLLFPLGLVVGWDGVAVFALGLLPFSLIFLGAIALARRGALGQGAIARRLVEIGRTPGIPYGVPMAMSAVCAVLWRLGS